MNAPIEANTVSHHELIFGQVESLTAARTAAMSGSEPSDAIRVVNALLTQIDMIKRCAGDPALLPQGDAIPSAREMKPRRQWI